MTGKILRAICVILSGVMCFVVGYNYAVMEFAGKYSGYSAPAEVAFLYAVPFIIVITALYVVAGFNDRKFFL